MPDTTAVPESAPEPRNPAGASAASSPGRLARVFGSLSAVQVLVLVVAVGFLGAAIGWSVAQRDAVPLSATDVGFMQDMGFHHEQAVQLSLLLVAKPTVDEDLKHYALEIIISQQADRGIFNATLDRFGHSSVVGDTVMGWMLGHVIPRDQMEGLATDAQVKALEAASGHEAESLWISLMSEHHLGGLHMADWEARHGHDRTTRNIARSMVRVQRGEVIDLARYRASHHLAIPAGFSDPTKDQRLNPISLGQDD